MFLMVFGLAIAAGLLLRPKSTIGGRSSFSRWWFSPRTSKAALMKPEVRALLDRRVRTELAGVGSLWIEGKASELLCVSPLDYTLLSEREEFLRLTRKICSILTVREPA